MLLKVLCVCKGNGDRSPLMAAVLQMFIRNSGHTTLCESAGILEVAATSKPASPLAVVAAKRIGIDLSAHRSRWTDSLHLKDYFLFICTEEAVAARLIELGVHPIQIYNAQITNPWPVNFQEDYDRTAEAIVAAMYRVVARHFPIA